MKYDTQELKYQSQTILVTLSLKPLTKKKNSKKKKKLPTYPIFFEGRNLNATIFFLGLIDQYFISSVSILGHLHYI